MDFLTQINLALNYIENNLKYEIKTSELSKIALCSTFHFSRMFSSMTGVTLSEYIRHRRLTLAAIELQETDKKILDIALDYGYSSPDAFSRAFYKQHNLLPSQSRDKGVKLNLYPQMTFQITIKGVNKMEYRIEELGFEFKVVGKKHLINTATATEEITKIYSQSHTNGLLEKLINMAWENPQCKLESILGVIGNTSSITEDTFEFIMGVRYDKSVNGMDEIIIPPCTWAVFPNIKDAWQRLYTEWLPSSNYELVDLPCIEHSLPPGNVPENELWVPLKYKE